jgi:ubiquinone/menaquinone biosynthesis C-methylase UbiE
MRRPQFIARQSRCPTGMLGRLIGRIMVKETAAANEQALRLLRLIPTDHVLEVGFGHGRTIQLAADALARGFVAGVDPSEEMVRMASRRNRHHIASGRVALTLSDALPLPFPDCSFDKVYCVHVLYFWLAPRDQLQEILRVLKNGGSFVLGFRAHSDARAADFPPSVYRFYEPEQVESLLADCGFQAITSEVSADRTVFVCARR